MKPFSILSRVCLASVLFSFFLLHSCINKSYSKRELAYYTKESNYIEVTGVITGIYQYEQSSKLVLSCEELSSHFSERYFKISGKNYSVVLDRQILAKIKKGARVEFISAQEYFYDGYQMPIVQLSVDGEELLSYEEGYQNLIEWLKEGGY